ncbi:hypothetical protein ACO1O0_009362 [Amphichorda felina]
MVRPDHDEFEPLMTDSERRDALGHDHGDVGTASSITVDIPDLPTADSHPDAPLESSNTPGSGSSHTKSRAVTAAVPVDDSDISSSSNAAQATIHRSSSPLEVRDDSSSPGSGTSTPRFLQDRRRWRRVPYSVRRVSKAVARWSRGPTNPERYRIRPLLPRIQQYPLYLVERFLPKRKWRFWLLFAYFSIWLITFVLVKRQGTLATEVAGWGQPQSIGCGVTYWEPDNDCGIDGNNCRPFSNSGFAFRCQANCESYHVLNPRAVGDQEVIYRSFVVGGPSSDADLDGATYRGDSFICGAAIHAGIISNDNGGCGVVELVGEQADFTASDRNGIPSVGFDSYFPLSYRFVPNVECESRDMRWELLAISAVFTGVLSLFTGSPALFFFPNFIGIFWTVGAALDTPPHNSSADLFSKVLGRFLPAMFCAWVMYDKMGIRRTLKGLTAQIEKTILWLGPCWVGAMDNYTLSFIPIQRLNAHDLQQQPGAKAALSFIIIALVVIIASQVWFFRQEGRFLKYIKLYALFVGGIVISLLLPGLNLRLHHYILALLLLPGTSLQTRPSLVYQGLLIGLFINGIARWGFDSVLQTPDALQGDAQLGTELPIIPPPVIDLANSTITGGGGVSNITFSWEPPAEAQFDGISILVNDVERFRSYFEDSVGQQEDAFVWHREPDVDLPEYFRFAFMRGSDSGDYTKAGVWTADGEWVEMKPGPSRLRARSIEEEEGVMIRGRR